MKPGPTRRRRLLQALPWGALAAATPSRVLARALGDAQDADRAAAAPLPMQEAGLRRSVVTSDGVQLSLIERRPGAGARDGDAPTLVFLPGWCMPAVVWREQLAGLGGRWPVLAIDPRGQGLSQVAPSGYNVDRRADDLHDALQAVDARPGIVRLPHQLVPWVGKRERDHRRSRLQRESKRLGVERLRNVVDGEGPAGQRSHYLDVALDGGGGSKQRSDSAKAAGVGYGGC